MPAVVGECDTPLVGVERVGDQDDVVDGFQAMKDLSDLRAMAAQALPLRGDEQHLSGGPGGFRELVAGAIAAATRRGRELAAGNG